MKRVTLIATALVLAVIAVLSTRVAAQDSNTQERSFLTFSAPVELPGVSLPAGTYVFRLADTPSRNVVQVLSKDEKDMIGQWTFVQADRNTVNDEQVIMFKEAREGTTPAVQFWYYPGERTGKEFIYPKSQAQQIANRTGAAVLSDEGRLSSNSQVSSADANGAVTTWPREGAAKAPAESQAQVKGVETPAPAAEAAEPAAVRAEAGVASTDNNTQVTKDSATAAANTQAAEPVDSTLRNAPTPAQPTAAAGSLTGNRGVAPAPESTRAEAQVAADPAPRAVGTSGSQRTEAVDQQARAELPRTASPLPLSGLIGLLALAGALGARAMATARQ